MVDDWTNLDGRICACKLQIDEPKAFKRRQTIISHEGCVQKVVLVINVGIPTYAQDMSHARKCPINVLPMSTVCPRPIYD